MSWEVELVGNAMDVGEFDDLSAAFNCIVASGVDGRFRLGGTRFDALAEPDDVRAEAARVLAVLNGLARLDPRTPALNGWGRRPRGLGGQSGGVARVTARSGDSLPSRSC